jgi:hypothetical protein
MAKLEEFIQQRKPRTKIVGLSLNDEEFEVMEELCEEYECSKSELVKALMLKEMESK